MAGNPEAGGPDLARGIHLSDIPSQGFLGGHVGDESVLVSRRDGEIFAVGGTCTHYSGPLAQGVALSDTVRCPWHHACFDLRSGEALRAPALSNLPRWRVEQEGERILVRERIDAIVPEANDDGEQSFVIVGAGAAGHAAAEMLRRRGFSGKIHLVGSDPAAPYDRPNLSKDYLAGNAPEEWIPLRPNSFYADQKIDLRTNTRATRVLVDEYSVELDDGTFLSYDRLLLAPGARPARLSVPGSDRDTVHYLRTLADSRRIVEHAEEAGRAVVVGGGFIGLEAASALRMRGLEVDVVLRERLPLQHVLGTDLGRMVRRLHEENGVRFHSHRTAAEFTQEGVKLDSGELLEAELVLVGVGVSLNLELARDAGITVSDGIEVDGFMRTSAPDVFAAGDVARWPYGDGSARIEHWTVAQRQGQCAALNMLGKQQPFDSAPFFWTRHYDVSICYVGHATQWDRIDVVGNVEERDCAAAFRTGGKTLAVTTVNRNTLSLEAEIALEQNDQSRLLDLIPPVE